MSGNLSFIDIDRITGTLREDFGIFVIASRGILLRMRNVSKKICRENQTDSLCSVTSFFSTKIMTLMR